MKDNGLSEAIKVAKSIHNLLEKYAKDKENKELSENERKEVADNYQLWLKIWNKLVSLFINSEDKIMNEFTNFNSLFH